MKICDEFSGTITLTENSSRELFKVLKEQDEAFINDVLCGRCGFTLKSADGRAVELIPAPKWIPCSERLPDLHKEHYTAFGNDEYFKMSSPVLVYRTGEDIEEEERIQVAQYEEDSYVRTFWETTDAEILTGVLAWMPLPDPYESEEDSE